MKFKASIFFYLLFIFSFLSGSAATYYTRGAGGNWSSTATWSTASCGGAAAAAVPGAADDVIICSAVTVTVDGNYSCHNLTVGNGNFNCTVQITSAANSLSIGGDLLINTGSNGSTYTLDAGPGTLNVNGIFSTWGTSGINNIQVSTGTITFVPAVNLSSGNQLITFTSTGTINFNAGFSCNQNQTNFITVAGCTANFFTTYTQTGSKNKWDIAATAVFKGAGCTINNSKQIDFGNVIIFDNASVSTAGAGDVNITGYLTLNTNSTFTTTKDLPGSKASAGKSIDDITLNSGSTFNLNAPGTFIQSDGNWINNGGTLNGGTYVVQFEGIGNSIGGTSSTIFPDLQLGNTLNNVNYTLDHDATCANLIFDADNSSRILTHTGASVLTVTGDVTMNQPTANSKNDLWDISGGSATVAGNLIFTGGNNTVTRICQLNVSSGSFTLNGNVTWMANAVEATEVISLNTGTMTFANSLSMPQESGTFNITGSGTVNFNGAAPSFDLNQANGGVPNAVFTPSFGSIINLKHGFRNATAAITFADGSTTAFTGNGTVTPTAAITFGNVQINAAVTATLAGNISLTDNWMNLGGTFAPATFGVTFSGTATQTITKAGGETFYNLTSNTTSIITLASNVMVTNSLNMTAGTYNLNANTLTLGNSAGATLTRTAGLMYGGTFKRWLPLAAISSTVAPLYGLFPMGNTTDYRPVEINSTVNPATAGYVSAVHTDALSNTDVAYNDNEAVAIQRITDQKSTLSTSGGFAGGTYNLNVSMTALGNAGVLTDLKMETIAGAPPGVGVTAATTGSLVAPTVKRIGLTAAQLVNDFVIGTKNKAVTPIRQFYYSIASGTWATPGVWSLTNGGLSCACTPSASGYAIITSSGTPVSVNGVTTIDLLDINSGATLNGTSNLTVNYDLTTAGTGVFKPTTGVWTVSRNVTMNGTGISNTASSAMSIAGDLTLSGTTLTLGAGLTVSGNLVNNGTISAGVNNITLNGNGKNINGTGTITGSGTITSSNAKTILAGTSQTIAPIFAISGAVIITNNGTVTLQNNLTGTVAGSTWTNNANSVLNITGALLTTGTLNASASPNTVNYNGAGAQAVNTPSANTYYNLSASNAGTKSAAASLTITNMLTIQNAATFSDATFPIIGGGGLTMSGTAVYQITDNTNPVPCLSGSYNLTGGTIDFDLGGNQHIRSVGLTGPAPAAYYNLTCSTSGTKSLKGPIDVQGNITISGTAVLDVSASNYAITLYGNWNNTSSNAAPFGQQNGTVIFSGSAAQTITNTGNALGTEFYNLTFSNTFGTAPQIALGVTTDIIVMNTLSMGSNDNINLNGRTLTLGTAAATPGTLSYTNGFMYGGTFTRWFNTGSFAIANALGHFPMGTSQGDYRPVWIAYSANLTAGGTVSVVHNPTYPSGTNPAAHVDGSWGGGTTLQGVSNSSWVISTANGFAFNGATGITRFGGTGFGLYTLTDLDASLAASVVGTYAASTNVNTALEVNRTALTSANLANTWRIGTKNVVASPLPVDLLSFEAKPDGNVVDVTWSTASEFNSDHFVVQRSKDGTIFTDVKNVDASGNSSTIKKYSAVDYEPYNGVSYYRLKQVDRNGKLTFSGLAAVQFTDEDAISVYPNPAIGPFNVSLKGQSGKQIVILVRDVQGREFFSKVVLVSNDKEVFAFDPEGKLAPGIYFIEATSDDTIYKKKIVIR